MKDVNFVKLKFAIYFYIQNHVLDIFEFIIIVLNYCIYIVFDTIVLRLFSPPQYFGFLWKIVFWNIQVIYVCTPPRYVKSTQTNVRLCSISLNLASYNVITHYQWAQKTYISFCRNDIRFPSRRSVEEVRCKNMFSRINIPNKKEKRLSVYGRLGKR